MVNWKELGKLFVSQVEGPVTRGDVGDGEEFSCLKRRDVFLLEGILAQIDPKNMRKTVKLDNLENRKEKAVPEHSLLGCKDNTSHETPEWSCVGDGTFSAAQWTKH